MAQRLQLPQRLSWVLGLFFCVQLVNGATNSPPSRSSLINIFLNKTLEPKERLDALAELQAGAAAEQSLIPGLMVVLKDKKELLPMREAAFEAWLSMAPNAGAFADDFALVLTNQEEPRVLREYAAKSLAMIAANAAESSGKPSATIHELKRALISVEAIERTFQNSGMEIDAGVTQALALLRAKTMALSNATPFSVAGWRSPWLWMTVLLVLPFLCLGMWRVLLSRSPLLLWEINERLRMAPELKLPITGETPIGLRSYCLVSFFQYHPKVLDAWLETHWPRALRKVEASPVFAEQQIRLALPIALESKVETKQDGQSVRPLFQADRVCLLIRGEDGSGRASLACEMARWAMADEPNRRLRSHQMLPVWIQPETNEAPANYESLIDSIRREAGRLLDRTSPLAWGLTIELLRRQRILVVIDARHISGPELNRMLQPPAERGPCLNAIVIISAERELELETVTGVVTLLPIEAETITEFAGAYLRARKKRELFADREFLENCVRLSDLAANRNLTPLLARLFLDHVIEAKEALRSRPLVESIPALILGYVDGCSRSTAMPAGMIDHETVRRFAKIVAWESLKTQYYPRPVSKEQIVEALGSEQEQGFALLHDKLRLIKPADSKNERYRFASATVAAYLACLRLIELLGSREAAWHGFLAELEKQSASTTRTRDFILAARDCHLALSKEAGIPDFVEVELGRLAGLDPIVLEKARVQMKVKQLIKQLLSPIAENRRAAVIQLGSIGAAAKAALPALVPRLRNIDENIGVRHAVIIALGEIGAQTDDVIPVLIETLVDRYDRLRPVATQSLITIGDKAIAPLVESMKDKAREEASRVAIAAALGAFKSKAKMAVPGLIGVVGDKGDAAPVRAAAAEALGQIGSEASGAVPDLVNLMQESKTLCRHAAKALIGIVPAAQSRVISLFELLHQNQMDEAESILTTFRFSLVRPAVADANGVLEKLNSAVEDALKKMAVNQDVAGRPSPNTVVSLVDK